MGHKKNIMHVIADLDFGGAQNQFRTIVLGLDKEKYNISVCCLRESGFFAKEIEESGIPVHVIGKKRKIDLGLIFKLKKLLNENEIDIVHTHNWTANLWGRLGAIFAGVKTVFAMEVNIGRERGLVHYIIDRVLSRFTVKIIANSNACRDNFLTAREGIPPEKIKVIYSAIDEPAGIADKDRLSIRGRYRIPGDAFVIGTISRLDRVKGHKYLILAAKHVVRHSGSAVFVITGEDASLKAELEALSAECGIEKNVRFIGWADDVSEIFAMIDIFVLPSLSESLPVSIIEAMYYGIPVVATTVGGVPELVTDGKTGFLVPPADEKALCDRITALMDDEALMKDFSQTAKVVAKSLFSADRMINEIEKLYDETTPVQ